MLIYYLNVNSHCNYMFFESLFCQKPYFFLSFCYNNATKNKNNSILALLLKLFLILPESGNDLYFCCYNFAKSFH